jgi:hypothetical protein
MIALLKEIDDILIFHLIEEFQLYNITLQSACRWPAPSRWDSRALGVSCEGEGKEKGASWLEWGRWRGSKVLSASASCQSGRGPEVARGRSSVVPTAAWSS